MATFWKVGAGLLMLALLAALQPPCVYACSCVPPGPPQQALADATAVFSGKVTAIGQPARPGSSDAVQVTFAVARAWKGPEQATITLSTPGSSASCGIDFVEHQEYLVYASTVDGGLQANLCSRTTPLANASEDITALGEGRAPPAEAGGAQPPPTLPEVGAAGAAISYGLPAAALGGALLVVLLVALMVARRRRIA